MNRRRPADVSRTRAGRRRRRVAHDEPRADTRAASSTATIRAGRDHLHKPSTKSGLCDEAFTRPKPGRRDRCEADPTSTTNEPTSGDAGPSRPRLGSIGANADRLRKRRTRSARTWAGDLPAAPEKTCGLPPDLRAEHGILDRHSWRRRTSRTGGGPDARVERLRPADARVEHHHVARAQPHHQLRRRLRHALERPVLRTPAAIGRAAGPTGPSGRCGSGSGGSDHRRRRR